MVVFSKAIYSLKQRTVGLFVLLVRFRYMHMRMTQDTYHLFFFISNTPLSTTEHIWTAVG